MRPPPLHRASPRWPAGFPVVLAGAFQFGTAWAGLRLNSFIYSDLNETKPTRRYLPCKGPSGVARQPPHDTRRVVLRRESALPGTPLAGLAAAGWVAWCLLGGARAASARARSARPARTSAPFPAEGTARDDGRTRGEDGERRDEDEALLGCPPRRLTSWIDRWRERERKRERERERDT